VRRWLLVALAISAVPSTGCRLFNRDRSDGRLTSSNDPLLGRNRNIPPTSLPTGRGTDAKSRDPLLTSEGRTTSDLPARKEPFRTGPGSTPAGLAAGNRDTADPLLRTGAEEPLDRRPAVSPAGRNPTSLSGDRRTSVASFDESLQQLRQLKVKVGEVQREGSEYVLVGEVSDRDGVLRRFEGVGRTADAAAAELLDQIRSR
jgi:hypothetical protein